MSQAAPADAHAVVIDVFRFGWAIAEFYGRCACWVTGVPATMESRDARPDIALPLREERSDRELAIQAQRVVSSLATTCKLDCSLQKLPDGSGDATMVSARAAQLQSVLLDATDETQRDNAFKEISALLYLWDSWIQDTLSEGSLDEGGAYQLGKGLAEIWWARAHSTQTAEPYHWEWLLGPTRRSAISLRLGQLNQCFPPDVAAAMRVSLDAWGTVADDPMWRRRPDAMKQLEQQVRIWRDVLLGEYNPENLLSVATVIENGRYKVWPIVRAFMYELIGSAIGLLLLLIAIVLLTSQGHSEALGSVLAVLGIFGLTGAAVVAKAKSAANNLATHLRATLYRELLAYQITVVPAKEEVGKTRPEEDMKKPDTSLVDRIGRGVSSLAGGEK